MQKSIKNGRFPFMSKLKLIVLSTGVLILLLVAAALFFRHVVNPAVENELRTNPTGEEAQEAMLLTFNDKTLPVNYLKEGNTVFMGVDGRWWRAFQGEGASVTMLIQGQSYTGHGVVVLDNQAYVDEVFSRLRPTAPEWLPDWLNGKLVVITIDSEAATES